MTDYDQAPDYVKEDENHEEIILTRWDKLKKWWEIFKVGKALYVMLFGVTGALAYGDITQTNPLRDAAIGVGLIEQTTEEIVDEIIIDEYAAIDDVVVPDHNHPHTHDMQELLDGVIPDDHMELH